ncbi:hypothetical protein [Neobacillus sp.]|uniref:hypothetical protein n=1 Tax=Neobacillus sp. TaxID=2675273 RepID=UPI002898FD22|nr:hypothetical protein [Neobacillus sp.]
MQTIIWAISSMVVLMIIISLLPLGYTLKGKFLVVLVSFILSLGGLVAVSTFPLWQTALVLISLIFFVAYFMNNRLGSLLVNENPVFEEWLDEEMVSPKTVNGIESLIENNLVEIDEEFAVADTTSINLENDTVTELSQSSIMSDMEDLLLVEFEEKNDAGEEGILEGIRDFSHKVIEETLPDKIDGDDENPLDDSLFDFLRAAKEVAVDSDDTIKEMEAEKKISLHME